MPRSTAPIPCQEFSHERSAGSGLGVRLEPCGLQRDEEQTGERDGHGRRAGALAVLEQLLSRPCALIAAMAT